MDKQAKKQLIERLEASGEIHRLQKSPNWQDAFTAYQLDTKDNVSLGCSKCYQKVLKWLKKN